MQYSERGLKIHQVAVRLLIPPATLLLCLPSAANQVVTAKVVKSKKAHRRQ